MEAANDNVPLLDTLMTPEAIAARITAASGVPMTGRTVWEKARRMGVARKIGRSMLISSSDIPTLLEEEKKWHSINAGKSTTSASVGPADSIEKVRSLLQKKKRKPSQRRA